ncbi:hypothetical protein [Thalassospira sp. TSL5-1]|uniref:hypothetical protein n=1 Tax=Thalassospira sp. TSL5-1 TaxID=1544451 RepID=UPI001438EFE7|nr:hypothetical protein [Thalassospira sp. TSL5-1]
MGAPSRGSRVIPARSRNLLSHTFVLFRLANSSLFILRHSFYPFHAGRIMRPAFVFMD